jgi:ADP-heptose:LPS heptosyltransferase
VDRWNEALHRFLDAHDDYVAVAVAKHLKSLDGLTDRVLRITSLPIASAAAVIAAADLFLGADSFPLHIADLWRVPGVALFGTSNLREYGFRFSAPMRHVDGAGNMDSIDVDSVVDAITSIARDSVGSARRYSLRDVLAPVVTLRYR